MTTHVSPPAVSFVEIDVNAIVPSPFQHRRLFDQDALAELGRSLATDGLLQSITVRAVNALFELVAGERRWRAAKEHAGWLSILARVLVLDDRQARRLGAAENLQRTDLIAIEEVKALAELVDAELTFEFGEDYTLFPNSDEVKWRVKALLTTIESDRRNGTAHLTGNFSGKVTALFAGLPKPKLLATLLNKDLPLLFLPEAVQAVGIAQRLNKAQTKALAALYKVAPELFAGEKALTEQPEKYAIQKSSAPLYLRQGGQSVRRAGHRSRTSRQPDRAGEGSHVSDATTLAGTDYPPHPIVDHLPQLSNKELADLKEDIARNGLLVPIVLYEGCILDGRHRYRACREIGVTPVFVDYDGDNPWDYVWTLNGERRHFGSVDQKYLCWKVLEEGRQAYEEAQAEVEAAGNRKRAEAAQGHAFRGNQHTPSSEEVEPQDEARLPPTRDHADKSGKTSTAVAQRADVSRSTVERMDHLERYRPDLAEKVRLGELKSAEARRLMKRDQVADTVAALPAGQFRVLYADPPWKYNDAQSGSLSDAYGAAEKHYPAMTLTELCALPVPALTPPDAVLFLWATAPLLTEALTLMAAWGFTHKAAFIWDKIRHNMGHYNSVRHEYLLIGTKGTCLPDVATLIDSVQSIERTKRHSEKPEAFRQIIDTLYPHGPRLELFRRGTAPPGWTIWGNEAGEDAA